MSLEADPFYKKGDSTSQQCVDDNDENREAICNQACCRLRLLIVDADGVLRAFDPVKFVWLVSEFLLLLAEARNVAFASTLIIPIGLQSQSGAILNKGLVLNVAGVFPELLTMLVTK